MKFDKCVLNFKKILLLNIVLTLLIILKLYTGSNIFILTAFVLTIIAMVISKQEDRIMYVIYLIPWDYAFKFNISSFTMYNFVLLFYMILSLMHFVKQKNINRKDIGVLIILSIILILNFISNIHYNYFENMLFYMNWLATFVALDFAIKSVKGKDCLKKYILLLCISVIVAGILGFIGRFIPNIQNNFFIYFPISRIDLGGIILFRNSGFSRDPNYFALLCLYCISQIIFDDIPHKRKILTILLLLGILTFSKMFILTFVLLIAICLGKQILNIKSKKNIILILLIILVVPIFLGKIVDIYAYRIADITDLDSLTTGRLSIWISYIEHFCNDNFALIFGKGFNYTLLNGYSSHNSYIYIIYKLGILGTIVLIYLLYYLNKNFGERIYKNNVYIPVLVILLGGFALDIIETNYFFILIFLIILRNYFIVKETGEVYEESINSID